MRNIILHSHIFKNAGTTFDHTLKKNFGNNFIDHRDDSQIIKDKQRYLEDFLDKNKNVKAFSSHSIHFNAQSNHKYNFHQTYLLRHPIERIKSVYNFEKKQPVETSLGAKMAKKLDLEQYIEWRMQDNVAATIRNCHTVFLSGEGPDANSIDKKFEIALLNIKNKNFIGIVNRYDESMVVFEENFKKYFHNIDLSYTRQNTTELDLSKTVKEKSDLLLYNLDSKLQKSVLEKNAYDLELYYLANKKLDESISNIEDFSLKLKAFRNRS